MAFYKRTNFLINPKFQLSFSGVICSIIFISVLIYPLILLDFFTELMTRYPQLAHKMQLAQRDLILYLSVIQVVFIVTVFIVFIFMTHKIAGPLHKLKMHLENIREGAPIKPVTFRGGDYFHDVAEEVSLFLDSIAHNQEEDFKYLIEVSEYIDNLNPVVPDDKKPILSEISRRLKDITSRYKKSL